MKTIITASTKSLREALPDKRMIANRSFLLIQFPRYAHALTSEQKRDIADSLMAVVEGAGKTIATWKSFRILSTAVNNLRKGCTTTTVTAAILAFVAFAKIFGRMKSSVTDARFTEAMGDVFNVLEEAYIGWASCSTNKKVQKRYLAYMTSVREEIRGTIEK